MAVTPVFFADTTTLIKRCRLSGANDAGALAMIDEAIQFSRARIYKELGVARVIEILGTAYSENPATEVEVLRMKANSVELMICKIFLLRNMPVLFMDGGGNKQERWNEEGFARKADERFIAAEVARLEIDIGDAFGDLREDENENGAGGVKASCIGPLDPCLVPVPGQSIFSRFANPNSINGVQGGCL